jgi:hypothetical protein
MKRVEIILSRGEGLRENDGGDGFNQGTSLPHKEM